MGSRVGLKGGGSDRFRIAPQMARNGQKWPEMAENARRWLAMALEMARNVQECWAPLVGHKSSCSVAFIKNIRGN
jgi:hypothetical protein